MNIDRELEKLYDEKFRPLNMKFKKIATDWQMKTTPEGKTVLNDHSDRGYDNKIIQSLFAFHDEIKKLSKELAPLYPDTTGYLQRLDNAVNMIRQGNHKYITGVTVDSYHTVWYEFHYELLKKLGREGKLSEDEI